MKPFIGKLAVMTLLLLLPLQGLAATWSELQCASVGAGADRDPGASYTPAQEQHGGAANAITEHAPCGLLFSALPATPTAAARADLPVFESTLSLLATLFFPEQPHRPPLFFRMMRTLSA